MQHEAEVRGIGVGVDDEGAATGTPAVILAARGEWLPVFVSPGQARSMQMALDGVPFDRPLTHDLLLDVVEELDGAVSGVRVDDVDDDTFYAKLDLVEARGEEAERKHVFDARPSDAVALALRADCPIYVTDDVLDDAGQPPGSFETDGADGA